MAFHSNEEIFNKLLDIEKLLLKMNKKEIEYSIEEISLDKASKILHCNSTKVIKLIKQKKLAARIQDGRYKIRIADIKKFQEENSIESLEERQTINIESTDDLIERLTGYRPKHRKSK